MCYSKNANRRTNHLQERALRKAYDDCEFTFEELLEKDGSCAIHHYSLQTLGIELCKVYHSLS